MRCLLILSLLLSGCVATIRPGHYHIKPECHRPPYRYHRHYPEHSTGVLRHDCHKWQCY